MVAFHQKSVKKCHSECVRLLLDISMHSQICDINLRLLSNGQSPLWMACDRGDVQIVKLLLQYPSMKCDINAVDNKGYTPLMKAVGKGHIKVVELLLDSQQNPHVNDLDLTMVNQGKQCATMMAARTGNYGMAQLLMQHPENKGVLFRRDFRNRSVLDFCSKANGLRKCELKQHQKRKEFSEWLKESLRKIIADGLHGASCAKDHDNVPHLPDDIVRYIQLMAY